MIKVYSWGGKPICDIEQWAFDRGEKMVDVTWKKKDVNPYAKNPITYYEEKDTMPESFWKSLGITEENGTPIKVTYRKPTSSTSKESEVTDKESRDE